VILLKTVVATQAILSNFRIESWAPWCYVMNFLRNFVCNWGNNDVFLEKKRHPPPPCCFACKISWPSENRKLSSSVFVSRTLCRLFREFWNHKDSSASWQNLFHEFCGLCSLGTLARVDIATFSCFNHPILRILAFGGGTIAPWTLEGEFSWWCWNESS
jgi:hypothetical protein